MQEQWNRTKPAGLGIYTTHRLDEPTGGIIHLSIATGESRHIEGVERRFDVLKKEYEVEDGEVIRVRYHRRVELWERRSVVGDELCHPAERDALRDRRLDWGEIRHERLT